MRRQKKVWQDSDWPWLVNLPCSESRFVYEVLKGLPKLLRPAEKTVGRCQRGINIITGGDGTVMAGTNTLTQRALCDTGS